MSDHAKYSPSAASRWLVCHGAPAAEAGLPDTDNVHSLAGTKAHDIVARVLTGEKVNVAAEASALGDDYVEPVLRCINAIESLRLEGGTVWIEHRVELTRTAPGLVWGTADVVILNGKRIDVVDHKFGAGEWVGATSNSQLQVYGLAALESLGRLADDVETVGLHILQPRHHAEEWWRSWDVAAAELRGAFAERVRTAVNGSGLTAGEHCRWCKAKATCPALRDKALAVAKQTFAPAQPAPPAPAAMSVADLALALEMRPVLELWLKAVHEEAVQRAHRGDKLPGLKLVPKEGNRKWIDDEEAQRRLEAAGVSPWEPQKLISPAQAEKRLGKGGKAAIADLTHRPVTGAVLVPDSDPRPALPTGTPFQPIEE